MAMIAEGVVSPSLGLLDASGAGLAAWITRHYGSDGFDISQDPSGNNPTLPAYASLAVTV
jgi:hypothetical protein